MTSVGLGSISTLRWVISPSTIRRGVVPVVIDAIQRASDWARSHVAQECGEICHPLWANLNSAPSVSSISRRTLSQAASFHRLPTVVLARLCAISDSAVRVRLSFSWVRGVIHRRYSLTSIAAAAFRAAVDDPLWAHSLRASAIAFAHPPYAAIAALVAIDNETPKTVSNHKHLEILSHWDAHHTGKWDADTTRPYTKDKTR